MVMDFYGLFVHPVMLLLWYIFTTDYINCYTMGRCYILQAEKDIVQTTEY